METVVKETFEVPETEVKAETVIPTRDELRSKGWSADELASAEKRGMVATKKKPEEEEKTEEVKTEAAPVEAQDKKPEEKAKTALPDFTMTAEQEKVFLDSFGPGTPQRGLYFRMKNERQQRQIESEARKAAEKRAAELEAQVKAYEAAKPKEVDELGDPIDPEEKPMTLKQFREMQKAEAEEIMKRQEEEQSRTRVITEAQTTQEEYARSLYPDFDETIEKSKDLLKNLETRVPEKWKQAQIISLVKDLQRAAANADKIDLDDNHAAHIAYAIGKLHPDYGSTAKPHGDASDNDGKSNDPKKANGGRLTPEQMKRIEENTQRRASSASVQGGGGNRVISVDDVDASTLNKMYYAERQKFRSKHPDRYASLIRG
jgi:hypothetical protein